MLELLIAIALGITAVVFISLTFPKAAATLTNNRQRMIATRFADSRIQELRAKSYPYIPVNAQADLGGQATCDCRVIDMNALPPDPADAVMNDAGITYTRRVCVHFVDRNVAGTGWDSLCPDDPLTPAVDRGLKNIRVHVFWRSGAQNHATEAETMVAR